MDNQRIAITEFLDRLARRERSLLVFRALAQAITALSMVLVAVALALSFGASRTVTLVASLTLGLGLVVASILWPALRRWAKSGEHSHQARHVETRLPGLRGRLITVVHRQEEAAGGSEALLARAASHATAALALIEPGAVHTLRTERGRFATASSAVLILLVAGWLLPIGPIDALRVLAGQSAASIRMVDSVIAPAADEALVGDITLRYVFPDYTGLDPREIPNSDGTIHAPPGTVVQIRARTASPFDASAIQMADEDPVDASLRGGRDIAGEITVTEDSTWRFLLFSGDEVTPSATYVIEVEADAPPVVVTSETGAKAVAVDRPIDIAWQVTDDYGVIRVSLQIQREDGTEEVVRREPIESMLELSGREAASPRDLGLAPGDKVVLHVVADDNDRASGGNRGMSEALEITVLGPKGYGRRLSRYHEKLRDVMLMALADFLEESIPPADDAAGMLQWVYASRERLDPIRRIYTDQWGEDESENIDGELVRSVLDAGGRLFRFTVTTFSTRTDGRQPVRRDFVTYTELHGETVSALEHGIYIIDQMLRSVAMNEVAKQAAQLASEAGELAQDAKEMEDAASLLARLDQLERLMSQMLRSAAKLSDGAQREFVNQRIDEAQGHMNEIRKAIAEGRLDDARAMLETLAQQLQDFASDMNEQSGRQQSGESELKQRFEQLVSDLEELEDEQEELSKQMATERQELGDDFDDAIEVWEQLDVLSVNARDESARIIRGMGDGREWSPQTLRWSDEVRLGAAGLRDSVRARDAEGALDRAMSTGRDAQFAHRMIINESLRPRPPATQPALAESSERVRQTLVEMITLLEDLVRSPAQTDPAIQDAARRMGEQQAELHDRQRGLEEEVGRVEQAMPTGDGQASEAMERAGQAMDEATESLRTGEAMAGEGHQRHAAGQLEETRQQLQRQMGQMEQMQRMQQRMEGEGGGEHGEGSAQPPDVQPEIPTPEAFQTPEAYRRALLEGMSEAVPEEFEALKKRFYEDLVRQ